MWPQKFKDEDDAEYENDRRVALPDHRSPLERDGIPGLSVGGLKLKALKGLFRKMVQLIIARTSP
jgi:hypothetical protein